jgi:hypothetical protein
MKTIKIAGLCLVAVFAFTALATASASAAAEPEYQVCAKAAKAEKGSPYKYLGHYADKECTTPGAEAEGHGKYELNELNGVVGIPFTTKSKASVIKAGALEVECKKDVGKGEVFRGGIDNEEITFSKCVIKGTKEACTTAGEEAGTIKTATLVSQLKYVNKEEEEFGDTLYDIEGPVVTFSCAEGETVELYGGVTGSLATNGKKSSFAFAGNEPFWSGGEEYAIPLQTASEEEAGLSTTEARKYAKETAGVPKGVVMVVTPS